MKQFDKFDLLPLSFSTLDQFHKYPCQWVLRKIFKEKLPSNAAMERGTAIELGIAQMFIKNIPWSNAVSLAQGNFDDHCPKPWTNKHIEERGLIPQAIEVGYEELYPKGVFKRWQPQFNFEIKGLPFVGYEDFHFETEDKEDIYIDLKSTKRKPNPFPTSHLIQQSLYRKASNTRCMNLYIVSLKSGCNALWNEVENPQPYIVMVEKVLDSMTYVLDMCETKEDMLKLFVPNIDDWMWNDDALIDLRKKYWGY